MPSTAQGISETLRVVFHAEKHMKFWERICFEANGNSNQQVIVVGN